MRACLVSVMIPDRTVGLEVFEAVVFSSVSLVMLSDICGMTLCDDAPSSTKRHAARNGKTGCYQAIPNFSFISGVFAHGSPDIAVISLSKTVTNARRVVASVSLASFFRSEERTDICHEPRCCEFGKHPLLGLRAADRRAAALNVESQAFDYASVVQSLECFERLEKIEQVAPLVSLQECAQLRREQFFA